VIDHEYDAIVVGAGGAGLRVSNFRHINKFRRLSVFRKQVSEPLASQSSSQHGLTQ
jgi:hypothetical protein